MPDYKRLIKRRRARRDFFRGFEERRKSPKGFLFTLLFAGLLAAVSFGLRSVLRESPYLKINEILVVDQNGKTLSDGQEFFRLEARDELSLFSFDMQGALRDIRNSYPQLADISIRKQFPNRLLIAVEVREPVAAVRGQKDFYLVDEQGFVLPFKSIHRDLPKIIGVYPQKLELYTEIDSFKLERALKLLKELKEVQIYPEYNISQIDVRGYADIILRLEDKIEIKMPQADFSKKVALLSGVLAELKTTETVAKYIDMRFADPIVKPLR
ncbi:MAG: cell division protein FtsQ/DivIB [Candidatus Omnitrophota bacterium]|nr:MAG: cell division protein FtsQ/DivIB [Candidatus Omnitrophota bacterium]